MLTYTEKEILKAIYQYVEANGISPPVKNICDLVGVKSKSTVHSYIKHLAEKGFITKKETIPRSIVITEEGLKFIKLILTV